MKRKLELARPVIRGRWQDTVMYKDGRVETLPWRCNQIQLPSMPLISGLLRRYFEIVSGIGGDVFYGIKYLAVGSGESSWDSIPPVQDQADETLTTEAFRKVIAATDMAFLDVETGAISATPTRRFQVSVLLDYGEANGTLREFALFGGDSTASADSGLMFNWVVHPRIDKDENMSIRRVIDITLGLGGYDYEGAPEYWFQFCSETEFELGSVNGPMFAPLPTDLVEITHLAVFRRIAGTSGTTVVSLYRDGAEVLPADERISITAAAGDNYAVLQEITPLLIGATSDALLVPQIIGVESGTPESLTVLALGRLQTPASTQDRRHFCVRSAYPGEFPEPPPGALPLSDPLRYIALEDGEFQGVRVNIGTMGASGTCQFDILLNSVSIFDPDFPEIPFDGDPATVYEFTPSGGPVELAEEDTLEFIIKDVQAVGWGDLAFEVLFRTTTGNSRRVAAWYAKYPGDYSGLVTPYTVPDRFKTPRACRLTKGGIVKGVAGGTGITTVTIYKNDVLVATWSCDGSLNKAISPVEPPINLDAGDVLKAIVTAVDGGSPEDLSCWAYFEE